MATKDPAFVYGLTAETPRYGGKTNPDPIVVARKDIQLMSYLTVDKVVVIHLDGRAIHVQPDSIGFADTLQEAWLRAMEPSVNTVRLLEIIQDVKDQFADQYGATKAQLQDTLEAKNAAEQRAMFAEQVLRGFTTLKGSPTVEECAEHIRKRIVDLMSKSQSWEGEAQTAQTQLRLLKDQVGDRPPVDVVVIHADDWEALYVNRKLLYQHHDVRFEELTRHVLKPFGPIKAIYEGGLTKEGYDWFKVEEEFPERFDDIPDGALRMYE